MEGCKAACRSTSCLKYWYTQDLRGVLHKFSLEMFPVHLTAFAVKSNTVWALLMSSGQRCSSNIHIDPLFKAQLLSSIPERALVQLMEVPWQSYSLI